MSSAALSARRGAATKYGPLAVLVAAVVLTIFTLPSGLILPQASPTQTLEYAPVPPNGSSPPGGNFSGLGLGSSSTLGTQPFGGLAQPPPVSGQSPTSKHCVGSPPRQTEDPLSPPCVGFYNGDNGGATYTGVTRDEVTVLYYLDGGGTDYTTSAGPQNIPTSTYVDLGTDPGTGDGIWPPMLRIAQTDFNARYQTYNRRVHFWIYFDATAASSSSTPTERRQDAIDNWQKLHPFAVIAYPQFDSQDYLDVMASHGVLSLSGSKEFNYGSIGAPSSYFQKYPGILWSFEPSIDYRAEMFAHLICAEVAGRQVQFSGNVTDIGKKRVLGLLVSQFPSYPEQQEYAVDVKNDLPKCGAHVDYYGNKYDVSGAGEQVNATNQMATFQSDGVTTIIDPGQGVWESRGAASLHYYPEWIVGGDGLADATLNGSLQDQTVWKNAWLMTTFVRRGPNPTDDPCVQSALEADPGASVNDVLQYYCPLYDSTRQLFTAIQVAGPHLDPAQVDQGFHAIPKISSSNNRVPACFYYSGDYTCVKDAALEWWDPAGNDPEYGSTSGSGASGCWRMVEGGARYLDNWPDRELSSAKKQLNDACNGQD